jgi:uncharacterized protein (DUF1778 family)
MKTESTKTDILKIRMDTVTLQLLDKARAYVDLDKSKFIRQSIREKAQQVIAEHEQTRFDAADWQVFFDMLDNPPQPSERLKKAAALYQQITTVPHEL